ncbi:hypothetical protein HZH66_011279 [Vespula vulgaris]|uniref:Uncharacterized protein n=1 Tax=Vespula vulgaris TaxID=7454 RepID=A0A834JFC6_VESVU|nr:hypothetical protein HZH66_011279 [Vespula vulgaris]
MWSKRGNRTGRRSGYRLFSPEVKRTGWPAVSSSDGDSDGGGGDGGDGDGDNDCDSNREEEETRGGKRNDLSLALKLIQKKKKKTQTQDYNNSLPEQEFDEWNRALSFLVHGSSGNTRMKRDVVEDERIRALDLMLKPPHDTCRRHL